MTQEEKDLLLRDLCARLPYKVKLFVEGWDSDRGCEFNTVETLIGTDDKFIYTIWDKTGDKDKHSIIEPFSILDYKPYLRPMSSITEDELQRYYELCDVDEAVGVGSSIEIIATHDTPKSLDYLNSIHVDYRGLIPKDLAISTEVFNPYKE